MVPLGKIVLVEVSSTADKEQVIPVPSDATGLLFAAMMAYTSAGLAFAIHNELSWIDPEVGSLEKTSNFRIPLIRDRGGIAKIDAYYFAGLSGEGEPLRGSSHDPTEAMKLYVFLAGTELPSLGEAFVRIQWGCNG